jgi:hypothetical protein
VAHPSDFEGCKFRRCVATSGWPTTVSREIALPVTNGCGRRMATSDFSNYKRSEKPLVGAVGIENNNGRDFKDL